MDDGSFVTSDTIREAVDRLDVALRLCPKEVSSWTERKTS